MILFPIIYAYVGCPQLVTAYAHIALYTFVLDYAYKC